LKIVNTYMPLMVHCMSLFYGTNVNREHGIQRIKIK